jgi:hypothetical protein
MECSSPTSEISLNPKVNPKKAALPRENSFLKSRGKKKSFLESQRKLTCGLANNAVINQKSPSRSPNTVRNQSIRKKVKRLRVKETTIKRRSMFVLTS